MNTETVTGPMTAYVSPAIAEIVDRALTMAAEDAGAAAGYLWLANEGRAMGPWFAGYVQTCEDAAIHNALSAGGWEAHAGKMGGAL